MALLRAENLSHSFDYPLFENLNLELCERECIAIQGSSGCGKSTLLHILSSLLKPKKGKVFVRDKDLYALSENARLKIRRHFFGIIFQMHYLFKGFSALENIELASVLSKQDIDEDLLERLGIDELLGMKIGKLSGGQQQAQQLICRLFLHLALDRHQKGPPPVISQWSRCPPGRISPRGPRRGRWHPPRR